MIKHPPRVHELSQGFSHLAPNHPFWSHADEYLSLYKPVDHKGRYLPYDQLRYRWPSNLDSSTCWSFVKLARMNQQAPILPLGSPDSLCSWFQTNTFTQTLSLVDISATTAALEYNTTKGDEPSQFSDLFFDLIVDEAISSSQLEGACTTTRVAKEMFKQNRMACTQDERMIVGNFNLLNAAWENRHQPLSLELITLLHAIGVSGIDDDKYSPGCLRNNDEVVVQDGDGNAVHQPPLASELAGRLLVLADWINEPHDLPRSGNYYHPLVKAIALHFAIGYEHPFRDGNGRVARALFYWFMFKHDFSAFRYISISAQLKNAPLNYGLSYLYTEHDGMDLTYFIDHQGVVISRAVNGFLASLHKISHGNS